MCDRITALEHINDFGSHFVPKFYCIAAYQDSTFSLLGLCYRGIRNV
jgi:hypothetical protein